MRYTEFELSSHDETPLFVRRYQPEHDVTRTVLVIHGASEHGQRYDHVARALVSRDWNVVVGDLRGQGLSGGETMHVTDFKQYVDDVEVIRRHFELQPRRTAILAHSMGGLIAIRAMQTSTEIASALVLSSPLLALDLAIPPIMLAMGRLASYVAPRARFSSQRGRGFGTRNLIVRARRDADPLYRDSVTAGWFFAMKSAMRDAFSQADRLDVPLLLLQAGEDQVVDGSAAKPWLASVGSKDKTYRLFPEHFHELLNELDWHDIVGLIGDWLEKRVSSPATAPANTVAV